MPGEDIASFGNSFNELVKLDPHEIQVGILKRLKGSPIIRHTDQFGLSFNPDPPYNILKTSDIDFMTMQRLTRFSRYWDLLANSGRFSHSKSILLGDSPYANFMKLSDWLYEKTGQTHKLALDRLFKLVYQAMIELFEIDTATAEETLLKDYERSGIKGYPVFLKKMSNEHGTRNKHANTRQHHHLT